MARRQSDDQVALAGEKQITIEQKGVGPLLAKLNKSLVDLGDGAGRQQMQLLSEGCSSRIQLRHFLGSNWILRILQHGDCGGFRQ